MKQPIDLAGIRAEYEAWKRWEAAMHGGTGAAIIQDSEAHREFGRWLIDGFPALLDTLDKKDAEISKLSQEVERLHGLLDRAVEDLAYSHLCRHCINSRFFSVKLPPCDTCANDGKPDWQWRGFSEREGG